MTDTPATAPSLLTISAVAARLNVGRNYVYNRIAEGDLKAINIGTPERSRLRVTEGQLADYIKARQDAGDAQP